MNPQTQAIQTANQLISIAVNLLAIYQQMVALDAAWTDNATANTLNALGTVALNADGSPGAADGTANPAHPINPALYPAMTRMLSSNQLASMKTILDNIVTYVNGGAVSATSSARAILNNASGG